jgi:hypothetical protein
MGPEATFPAVEAVDFHFTDFRRLLWMHPGDDWLGSP